MTTIIATIKPRHLGNIRSGKKKWEIRKTIPHVELPFRVLCCEGGSGGQIKAEFVCDKFRGDTVMNLEPTIVDECCVPIDDIEAYSHGKYLYLWHISNLVDYCAEGQDVKNIADFGLKRAPQSWQYLKGS